MDASLSSKAEQLAGDIASQVKTVEDLNELLRSMVKSALERMLGTEMDVLVVEVPTASLEEAVDQFTIGFETAAGGTFMVFRWERTEVRVPLSTP